MKRSAPPSAKSLLDEYGIIREALRKLPSTELKLALLESLAELEDPECHRRRSFPRTRLHRVRGVKQAIYRADITKISGWRLHLQYIDGRIVLKDVIEGSRHDDPIKVIRSKKGRYRQAIVTEMCDTGMKHLSSPLFRRQTRSGREAAETPIGEPGPAREGSR